MLQHATMPVCCITSTAILQQIRLSIRLHQYERSLIGRLLTNHSHKSAVRNQWAVLQLGVQKVFFGCLPAGCQMLFRRSRAGRSDEEYQDLVYNHHIWVNEDEPDPAQRELYRMLHVLPSADVLEDEARTMPAPNNSILSMPATTNTTTPPPPLTSSTTSLSS